MKRLLSMLAEVCSLTPMRRRRHAKGKSRNSLRPSFEILEGRDLASVSLSPIPNQSIPYNQHTLVIPLAATLTIPNAKITYFGEVVPTLNFLEGTNVSYQGLAYQSVWDNWGHQGEKWLQETNGEWDFIKPNGQLSRWDQTPYQASGTLVRTFDTTYYNQPVLLDNYNRISVSASVHGSTLTLTNNDGYIGSVAVGVDAREGTTINEAYTLPPSYDKEFTVTFTDSAPVLAPVGNYTLAPGQNSLVLPLTGSNAQNDPLTFSVQSGNLGYLLKQKYEPTFAGSYFQNYGGQNEKWLLSNSGWINIRPNGDVYLWDRTANQATGTRLGSLDPVFYQFPDLLASAQPGDLATVLHNRLGLSYQPGADSYAKLGVKWFSGAANEFGNSWYFLNSSGQLHAWNGAANQAGGDLLAAFNAAYFKEPDRLNAPVLTKPAVSFANNTITVTPGTYIGDLNLLVTLSDGRKSTFEFDTITVTGGK